MNHPRILGAAALGAVLGALAAGLWWTVRDRGTVCLGGCSPSDKNLPLGDVTLAVGAVVGAVVAVAVLLVLTQQLWRQR